MTRIDELQTSLAEHDIDAAVLRLPENLLLLTGYWTQIGGLGIVVVPREGDATLLAPGYEEDDVRRRWRGDFRPFPAIRFDGEAAPVAIERLLGELCREHGVAGGTIGFEGSFESVAPPRLDGEPSAVAAGTQALIRSTFATEKLADISPSLERIRLVKSEEDLERLRITNEIAALGLNAFKEAAVAGRTEAGVAAAVEAAIVAGGHGYRGTRTVRTYATVLSGPATAYGWQYFLHSDRTIEPDDIVMLELGTCGDGYWADHTRTVVAGRASDRLREVAAAVREAASAAFAAARPGAVGGDVDARSRAVVAEHGFTQFPHHTGHGTGFRYHESRPQLVPGSDHRLEAGMVIVTEPGIYDEAFGGFRWEDDAVVTADGAKLLASTSYDID